MEITEPIRLSTGSHVRGSGRGCAMNVISWELGEERISDVPKGVEPRLASMVHMVNDTVLRLAGDNLTHASCYVGDCTEGAGTSNSLVQMRHGKGWAFGFDLLDGQIGLELLQLAHMTVGTKSAPNIVERGGHVEALILNLIGSVHGALSKAAIPIRTGNPETFNADKVRSHLLSVIRFAQGCMGDARDVLGLPRGTDIPAPSAVDAALRQMYVVDTGGSRERWAELVEGVCAPLPWQAAAEVTYDFTEQLAKVTIIDELAKTFKLAVPAHLLKPDCTVSLV